MLCLPNAPLSCAQLESVGYAWLQHQHQLASGETCALLQT